MFPVLPDKSDTMFKFLSIVKEKMSAPKEERDAFLFMLRECINDDQFLDAAIDLYSPDSMRIKALAAALHERILQLNIVGKF